MRKNLLIHRIEQRLKELGLSARAASLKAGLSADAIRNIQRDPESIPRGRTLVALATGALETKVEWLLGLDTDSPAGAPPGLPYGGIVEAGAFRPVDMLSQEAGRMVPLPRDPSYPRCRQYAFEVRGDSMNLAHIEDGMWVTGIDYLDFAEWHGEVRDRMIVVAEHSRAQGAERELTVKEVRLFRDRMELLPRSSNPDHRPLIVRIVNRPVEDDHEATRILAIVTGATRLFRYD